MALFPSLGAAQWLISARLARVTAPHITSAKRGLRAGQKTVLGTRAGGAAEIPVRMTLTLDAVQG